LLSIQGDIARIRTDIGEILISLATLMPKPGEFSLWWIAAAVVVIAAITGAAFLILRRRRKRAGVETLAESPAPDSKPAEEPVQPDAPQAPKTR
jgi:LPXTG-motif cell wall-anchored protein